MKIFYKHFSLLLLVSVLGIQELRASTDTIPPVITFKHGDHICHEINTPYNSEWPTVTDNVSDSSQISMVLKSTDVDEHVAGIYMEVFEAVDGAGNKVQKTRFVTVKANCNGTSVNAFSVRAFNVYPNPASQSCLVQSGFEGRSLISVYDLNGSLMLQTDIDDNYILDLKAYEPGVYHLVVSNGDKLQHVRLIVTKD